MIPSEKSIDLYIHCSRCIDELPTDQSPRQWAQLEVGWTAIGLQVWCKRHELNVMHIDFQGATHPANTIAIPAREGTPSVPPHDGPHSAPPV